MLTAAELDRLANEIMSLGFSRVEAGHFAALIGDTPVFDSEGRVVVVEDSTGQELARLDLGKFFGMPKKVYKRKRPLCNPHGLIYSLDLDDASLEKLVAEILALGHDRETASRLATLIVGFPFVDAEERVCVLDYHTGKLLCRLKLDLFLNGAGRNLPRNPNDPEFFVLYQCLKRHGIEDRKAGRWSALVGLSGGPAIGPDGCFPVIDENDRELARLPAAVLSKAPVKPPEFILKD